MELLHQRFLNLLKAALHGGHIDVFSQEELPGIFGLAQTHKVLPLIFDAAAGASSPGVRQIALQQIAGQAMKTQDFLALYQHLSVSGVQPLVVKGIICRSLYPKPDLRPSGDEDLWITPEQLDACRDALHAWGMTTSGSSDAYELPYRKPGSPLYIELHKSLFPPDSSAYGSLNSFFDGAFDRATEVTVDGVMLRTLAPTDHLFYLICHAFKHFLHSGFGIRQVCDIVLYATAYDNDIHWQAVLENCRAIRAEQFTAAIFKIGDVHLGFSSPAAFQDAEVDEVPLLEDILSGGVYGSADPNRLHSSNITLSAASQKSSRGLMTSLFPPVRQLKSRYPYLKKYPWLLPVAWCSRIFGYVKEDSSAAETIDIGSRRVALLEQYGIIPKT